MMQEAGPNCVYCVVFAARSLLEQVPVYGRGQLEEALTCQRRCRVYGTSMATLVQRFKYYTGLYRPTARAGHVYRLIQILRHVTSLSVKQK